jgi:hypothetical protein
MARNNSATECTGGECNELDRIRLRLSQANRAAMKLTADLCRLPTHGGSEDLVSREEVMSLVGEWRKKNDSIFKQETLRRGKCND